MEGKNKRTRATLSRKLGQKQPYVLIIFDNRNKSRGVSQVVNNSLFYVAYSRELRGRLLQRQARDLLVLITNSELLPSDRIRLCLADDNLSDQKDFTQRQKGRLGYDR